MLSRVAESLYWSARYVERAEDVCRLLDVEFHALLDAQVTDRGVEWQRIVALLGEEDVYREQFDDYTASSVSEWVLRHPENPNSVVSCITLARENIRSVREQVSSEMWEAMNRLFLLVRSAGRAGGGPGPHALFEQLRNGTHLFQGTADATMVHGEPHEFIQLGLHLERAEKTARIVAARYPIAAALPDDEPRRNRELIALLRSCSAFEAWVKRHGTDLEPWPVADFLLRSDDFPRAALYCLSACQSALAQISGNGGQPQRILGRLCAGLRYGDVADVAGPAVARSLGELLGSIGAIGEALTTSYFSSQTMPAAVLTAQEAQQQQCG